MKTVEEFHALSVREKGAEIARLYKMIGWGMKAREADFRKNASVKHAEALYSRLVNELVDKWGRMVPL